MTANARAIQPPFFAAARRRIDLFLSPRSVYFFLALLPTVLFTPASARAAEWLLSFEVVSSGDTAGYTERAIQTSELVSELVPSVLDAMGLESHSVGVEIAPSGNRGKLNPSVLLHLDGAAIDADSVARALAYVFAQKSVLVWADGGGDTAAGAVKFPYVTPNLAANFFRHAASMRLGLGGFTARGQEIWFFNLRDADGRPLSGLADAEFESCLRRAAWTFHGVVMRSARVEARIVPAEQQTLPALQKLRARYAEFLLASR